MNDDATIAGPEREAALETSPVPWCRSPGGKRLIGLNFSNVSQRAEHLAAFRAWLSPLLRTAPGIDWDALPSKVIGFLMNTADATTDCEALVLAVGCAKGVRVGTLYNDIRLLNGLLRRLRSDFGLRDLNELQGTEIWQRFAGDRDLLPWEGNALLAYGRYAAVVVRAWLESLPQADYRRWVGRVLPAPPVRLAERFSQIARIEDEARERRKERADVLVPLFPLLVALAELRKQAMQRLLERYREECRRVDAGQVALPHRFTVTETLRSVDEGTLALAEARFIERQVTMTFILWDRRSWALGHRERYGETSLKHAALRSPSSSFGHKHEHYFLQYEGAHDDLLWFGDLLAEGALHQREHRQSRFLVSRSGLLQPPGDRATFLLRQTRPGEILLDPESLYRGVLYGAALAAIALTNASRLSELLQVAMESYVVQMVPEFDEQLHKTGRLVPCYFQRLLPKGATHDAQRQLFLITPEVADLLNEIAAGLEAAHGDVPVVRTPHSSKAEDLQPARYLFQWAASDDGQTGLLLPEDVVPLLRFIFHGLPLATLDGEAIEIVTHLLRHVATAHSRHVKKVPEEIIATYMLHHKLLRVDVPGPRRFGTSLITDYYTRLPRQDQLGLLYTLQTRYRIAPEDILVMPDMADLEAMEVHFREIFEQWGTIAPVTFGWCGSPGLCVRPDNRNHCLGCGYLQPDWRRFANIAPHRTIYEMVASRAEEQGLGTEVRQAHANLAHLDGLVALMRAQRVAWEDRRELPVIDRVLGTGAAEDPIDA